VRRTKRDSRVRVLYVFGSRAGGIAHPEADLDLAVWTSDGFRWQDLYGLRGAVTRELHSDRVDMVWLNRSDPALAFQVLKTGRVLFARDPDQLNDFELKAKQRFWDYGVRLRRHRRDRDGIPA
jgi:predicted nucleotidyltransferase